MSASLAVQQPNLPITFLQTRRRLSDGGHGFEWTPTKYDYSNIT